MGVNKNGRSKENPDMEEEVDIITPWNSTKGKKLNVRSWASLDFNGKEYIALIPDDGTDDVYIYGYKEVGEDEFEIVDIDDDAELEAVAAEFDKIMDERGITVIQREKTAATRSF